MLGFTGTHGFAAINDYLGILKENAIRILTNEDYCDSMDYINSLKA